METFLFYEMNINFYDKPSRQEKFAPLHFYQACIRGQSWYTCHQEKWEKHLPISSLFLWRVN